MKRIKVKNDFGTASGYSKRTLLRWAMERRQKRPPPSEIPPAETERKGR